jgi:hypothetical protein
MAGQKFKINNSSGIKNKNMSARSNAYFATVDADTMSTPTLNTGGYDIILPVSAPTFVDDVLSVSNIATGQTVWKAAQNDRYKVYGNILKNSDKVCTSGSQTSIFGSPVTVTPRGFTEYNIRFSGWCLITGAVTSIKLHLEWGQGTDQEIDITAPIGVTGAKQVFNVDFTVFASGGNNSFNIGCEPTGGSVTWYADTSSSTSTSFTITEISLQI